GHRSGRRRAPARIGRRPQRRAPRPPPRSGSFSLLVLPVLVLLALLVLHARADGLTALRDLVLLVAHHRVAATAAVDPVEATAVGDDQVVAGTRLDDVVAATRFDRVVPVGALDPVGLAAAQDLAS